MTRPTGYITDELFRQHDTGPHHPETARRLDAVAAAVGPYLDDGRVTRLAGRDATIHDLTRCHTEGYVHLAEHEIHLGLPMLSTGDTVICKASWGAALRATGSALEAVDRVLGGELRNCFVAPRPPGHHATADRGMGFCVFNHAAIAARYAQHAHGLGRVLIADWDVHHGNGTQFIFYDDPSVLFFSTHQLGLFPPNTGAASERGEGAGEGFNLNCPMRPGDGRAKILGAFESVLVPAADDFKPELILLSAGFDARHHDPLGDLRLTDPDFADLTRLMMRLADQHCDGRLVSVLEGGYDLEGLSKAVAAHVGALCGG